MKQTPDLQHIQEKMKAGTLTLKGFLGDDTRTLSDIIAADELTVASRGWSHERIAAKLADLTERGRDLMEGEIELDGRFRVSVRDDRGKLPSPWGDGRFEKGDTVLVEIATGRVWRWNPLTLHMVKTHGFYGGKGSDYRLDPQELIDLIGL